MEGSPVTRGLLARAAGVLAGAGLLVALGASAASAQTAGGSPFLGGTVVTGGTSKPPSGGTGTAPRPPGPGGGTTGGSTGGTTGGGGTSMEDISYLFLPAGDVGGRCAPADGDPLTGMVQTVRRVGLAFVVEGQRCLYAVPLSAVTVVCGYDADASYTGATGNPDVTPRSVTFPRVTTRFGAGERTPAACADSATATFRIGAADYGIHTLALRSRQSRCVQVSYADAPARLRDCSAPYIASQGSQSLAVFCGGWVTPGRMMNWSLQPCLDAPGGWSCEWPAPTIDGRRIVRGQEAFADGKQHSVAWPGGPRIAGLGNVRTVEERFVMGGTPKPVMVMGRTDPKLSPVFAEREGSAWSWAVRWYGGSDTASPYSGSTDYIPWKGTAGSFVEGTLTSTYPESITVALDGTMTVTEATRAYTANGVCASAPAEVTLKRARNTNE